VGKFPDHCIPRVPACIHLGRRGGSLFPLQRSPWLSSGTNAHVSHPEMHQNDSSQSKPALTSTERAGEVKLQATVQDIAQGPYTATCRLIKGDALDDISHSVSFSVGNVPEGPRGDEHFCPACKMADSCQGETADQCSGRGTCRNGACMCFADFAGDQCEVTPADPHRKAATCARRSTDLDALLCSACTIMHAQTNKQIKNHTHARLVARDEVTSLYGVH
jgi:hypothetical protein